MTKKIKKPIATIAAIGAPTSDMSKKILSMITIYIKMVF
jgi:hypothetical protein